MALKDTYALSRTDMEMERVEAQGKIWSINLDYHLHPKIEQTLPKDARIADIGTGTGSYLVELSEMFPKTCCFDGFDVSNAMFRSSIPPNVSLHLQDARSGYPQEYHGKFDAIHLRLLVGGFDKDDWAIAAENTIKLLKPGGAIQWEEANFPESMYLRAGGKHASAATLESVLKPIKVGLAHRFKWGYNILHGIFVEKGLTEVETDVVSSDRVPDTRRPLAVSAAAGGLGWAKKSKRLSEAELIEIEKKLEAEIAGGAYWRFDIWATIGFKPKE